MRTPLDFVRGVYHPEAFHGRGVRSGFFEGWYVKLVSADTAHRWAVIPGVFLGDGDSEASPREAFVQLLNGSTGESWYHHFPVEQFRADARRFDVHVGDNRFSPTGVHLELPQLSGDLDFTPALDPWPVRWRSPGVMGPYGLVPFMECYHGVVSLGHGLSGQLQVHGQMQDFTRGRGYIEKDWGSAFPAGYVWIHSNHLDADAEASFVGSVAIIPWKRSSFRGFIVGLKHHGRLHVWATYNGAQERSLLIEDATVHWVLDGPAGRLTIDAVRTRGGLLHAPLRTAMHRRVEESLDSQLSITHTRADGAHFEARSACTGMEVFGDIDRLLATRTKRR